MQAFTTELRRKTRPRTSPDFCFANRPRISTDLHGYERLIGMNAAQDPGHFRTE